MSRAPRKAYIGVFKNQVGRPARQTVSSHVGADDKGLNLKVWDYKFLVYGIEGP